MNDDLSKMLASDIDTTIEAAARYPHRWHLGASIIGRECLRSIWYSYRWCAYEIHDARKLRLFKRGHREEAVMVEMLRSIGATVVTDINGKQSTFSSHSNHFGGSSDTLSVMLPARYGISVPVLAEFKTKKTGAGFKSLAAGIKTAEPQHWAQVCTYGNGFHLNHYIYMVVCKDNDDLHREIGEIDISHGVDMENRAGYIIGSQSPPPKLSSNPTFWKCKMCSHHGICHTGAELDKNCRSCKHATPAANGEWKCGLYHNIIPRDFVRTGCERWEPVA